ncbi:MAG: hypothetical protein PHP92_03630 [Candidatus Nanoarchaeia archaeon]|nr:hypothetical protein [Candidatus Nanoarchaeia archaeon]
MKNFNDFITMKVSDEETMMRQVIIGTLEKNFKNIFNKDIHLYPFDNFDNGTSGFIILDNKKEYVLVTHQNFKITKTIMCKSYKEIKSYYLKHIKKEQLIIKYDLPEKLQVGFIVITNSENIFYTIRLKDFRETNKKGEKND